jgi:hypothetical protein
MSLLLDIPWKLERTSIRFVYARATYDVTHREKAFLSFPSQTSIMRPLYAASLPGAPLALLTCGHNPGRRISVC